MLNTQKNCRESFWIPVKTYHSKLFSLSGYRLHNSGKKPLILFPGLYQNAFAYDLSDDISLAKFLFDNDFDVWLVHPRGTANSEGRLLLTTLDDYACDDIPTIIDYVKRETAQAPIFVGQSQGGVTALISLMGLMKTPTGNVFFSDKAQAIRSNNLSGLVTIGSYLDYSFRKPSTFRTFIEEGFFLKFKKHKIHLMKPERILNFIKLFNYMPMPIPHRLRMFLLGSRFMHIFLFPLTFLLRSIASNKIWSFLFNIPNVSQKSRQMMLYKTSDGSFSRIIQQFYQAILQHSMHSFDGTLDYSANYNRITLPISMVGMGLDDLVDANIMKTKMFEEISSKNKYYTKWDSMGHVDHLMAPRFFPLVLEAINKIA